MNGRRILFWIVIALVVYFVVTNTGTSGSVLDSMTGTLIRWAHDIYVFFTGATGAHP